MRLLASLACLYVLCGCTPPQRPSPNGTPIKAETVETQLRQASARDKMQEGQPEPPVLDVGLLLSLADYVPDANEHTQLRLLAERGDPNAECRLGWYYCRYTRDANETLKWF